MDSALDFTNLILFVTTKCNFTCRYCFIDESAGEATMSFQVFEKALDLIPRYFSRERCTITFFGGEPLLRFDEIGRMCETARSRIRDRALFFSVTTNGSLLNRRTVEFLALQGFSVVVSVDSFPELASSIRVPRHGDPKHVHAEIIESIKSLVGSGVRISCNIVLSPGNIKVLPEFVQFLLDMGVVNITLSPVADAQNALGETDFIDLRASLQAIIGTLAVRPGVIVDPISSIVRLLTSHTLHLYRCGYARLRLAVQPDGSITPCHRISHNMGSVWSGIDLKVAQSAVMDTVDRRLVCADCGIRYLCGGYCYHESIALAGDPRRPFELYCDLFRFVVQETVRSMFRSLVPLVISDELSILDYS
jgi:uncharacterized protein